MKQRKGQKQEYFTPRKCHKCGKPADIFLFLPARKGGIDKSSRMPGCKECYPQAVKKVDAA